MEHNDRPIDFERLRLHVSQIAPCREEDALSGSLLTEMVERKLNEERFHSIGPSGYVFLQDIRDFFAVVCSEQEKLVDDGVTSEQIEERTWNSCRITETQLDFFLHTALEKFLLSFVEPGEALGAIGAQSISEPGTQMTLKVGLVPLSGSIRKEYRCRLTPTVFWRHRRFTLVVSAP
jgi:DNA-directed RNA polymerase III subunit RPC1